MEYFFSANLISKSILQSQSNPQLFRDDHLCSVWIVKLLFNSTEKISEILYFYSTGKELIFSLMQILHFIALKDKQLYVTNKLKYQQAKPPVPREK